MTDPQVKPLAIIAGGGKLPGLLVSACQLEKRPYVLVALNGHADALPHAPDLTANLGDAGTIFETLRNHGVAEVVMAGKVQRPGLRDLKPDWRTVKFLARSGMRAFTNRSSVGDDRLLRSVISEIEREGLTVIGVDEILSDLVVKPGPLTQTNPGPEDEADIALGLSSARSLGETDKGQAVTVQNGKVLAEEDPVGTDNLIERTAELKAPGPGPILVKTSKPQQDRRADLPAIGLHTLQGCIAAGFRGIVIEANATLVMDRDTLVDLANKHGVWIVALAPSGEGAA